MAENKRFEIQYKQGSEFTTAVQVWVDRETGVNYIFMKSGYGAGLTPLLDREGKPVISAVAR